MHLLCISLSNQTMANLCTLIALFLIISSLCIVNLSSVGADERKVYIVYMGALPDGNYSPLENHHKILREVLENCSPSDSLIHNYKRSFNGFAAKLTERESKKLSSMEGIVSVFPDKTYKLQTTRSWDFVGLTQKAKRVPEVESDVIIGVIDTGIWPESESFNDEGFGPPPKKWKGECNGGFNFTCNNKLIGARTYGFISARDDAGHGTHTASTAAGTQVNNVSFYGLTRGNARGGVPSARIAAYKVCSDKGCDGAAILASFDDAIGDGVDILSVSLGFEFEMDYLQDSIAIGSFHAMQKGVLVSQAAGNGGPLLKTVTSIAPWTISVAASNIDRKFVNKVVLGDNTTFLGNAVNAFESTELLPLVAGGNPHFRRNITIEGKIVAYTVPSYTGKVAVDKHAAGMIVPNSDDLGFSFEYPLPASSVSESNFKAIYTYLNSLNTSNPSARILKAEVLNDTSAPFVASFSARGPSKLRRDILKPDITAPGADIIAAWSPVGPPSGVDGDTRSVKYNIISGTSMSCPHVTAAAAYVKSFNPNWSPAAIKSALMTTAFPLNATSSPEAEFAYGAGQIDPVRAVNPGLVYDADVTDYINVLCGLYKPEEVKQITGEKTISCPKVPVPLKDLNYPTFVSFNTTVSFKRTVTNVGSENSTYKATINVPPSVQVTVEPNVLTFESLNEKKSFVVTVTAKLQDEQHLESASLVWSDGIHRVRSPIAILLELPE